MFCLYGHSIRGSVWNTSYLAAHELLSLNHLFTLDHLSLFDFKAQFCSDVLNSLFLNNQLTFLNMNMSIDHFILQVRCRWVWNTCFGGQKLPSHPPDKNTKSFLLRNNYKCHSHAYKELCLNFQRSLCSGWVKRNKIVLKCYIMWQFWQAVPLITPTKSAWHGVTKKWKGSTPSTCPHILCFHVVNFYTLSSIIKYECPFKKN